MRFESSIMGNHRSSDWRDLVNRLRQGIAISEQHVEEYEGLTTYRLAVDTEPDYVGQLTESLLRAMSSGDANRVLTSVRFVVPDGSFRLSRRQLSDIRWAELSAFVDGCWRAAVPPSPTSQDTDPWWRPPGHRPPPPAGRRPTGNYTRRSLARRASAGDAMSYRRLEAPPPESSHHQYESLAASAAPGDYADEQRVATPWRLRTRHVPLWVRAEVDAKVWAGRPTAVTVLIAREDLGDAVDGRASDLAHGNADPDRPLLIEAVAAANVQVESAPTVLRDVPRAGASNIVAFSVRFTGTAVDKAELRILVSQDGVPLHRPLVLQPHILGHGPGRGQPTSTQQAALVAPPPAKRAVGRLVVHAAAVSGGVQVPVPQLRIWTEERGQYFVYRYELSLRDGRFRKGYESPQVRTSPRAYAEELYRKIELGWAETLDSAAFQQRLRSLGGLLWDELIPADLGAILWNLRDQTDGILLYSDEPYIPWELVHLKKPGTKVLPPGTHFLADLGLIRWRVQPLLDSLPALRDGVRHVIPDYPDPTLALTSLASERGFLQNALGSHPVTPHSRPVLEQLADEKLELLHFAGHGVSPAAGGADAMLLLEGETTPGYGTSPPTYRRETLLMAEVDQHFDRTSTPTTSGPDPAPGPIVVLNACQSGRLGPRLTSIGGFATVFVDRGASLFVGTLWSVGDEPALTFTLTFYMRLLAGDAVVTATTAARRAARANGDATWLAYTVYGHPRARLITAGDDSEIQ